MCIADFNPLYLWNIWGLTEVFLLGEENNCMSQIFDCSVMLSVILATILLSWLHCNQTQ